MIDDKLAWFRFRGSIVEDEFPEGHCWNSLNPPKKFVDLLDNMSFKILNSVGPCEIVVAHEVIEVRSVSIRIRRHLRALLFVEPMCKC